MSWPCFLVERTGRVELSLRRWVSTSDERSKCAASGVGVHAAMTRIGTLRRKPPPPLGSERLAPPVEKYAGDERWPKRCACGFRFRRRDHWQVWADRIWRRVDTGETMTLRGFPPGAMFDAWWMHGFAAGGYVGPDGLALTVCLPPDGGTHCWHIDGPATNGGRWQRSGVPPMVTVTPSIQSAYYHGYLTDGVLTDPL